MSYDRWKTRSPDEGLGDPSKYEKPDPVQERADLEDEMLQSCTCHPDDAPIPCPRKFAAHHCWRAAVYDETRQAIIELKNRDRSPVEQKFLDYLKRVERALDGTY